MLKLFDTFKLSAIAIFIVVACIACDQKNSAAKNKTDVINTEPPSTLKIEDAIASNIADNLWKKSQQYLSTAHTKAMDLHVAVKNLLANPDEKSLNIAQQKWQLTMTAYQQLSPLLYLEHKHIEQKEVGYKTTEHRKKSANSLVGIEEWRKKIGAWPIQPGYLDSFGPHIHSGIVNDITLLIDSNTLRSQHLMTDSEEVTLGLYAIEYLLFGDKEYQNKKNTNFKRFIKITELPEPLAQAGLIINELPNNRRRALVELQARLLVNDIHMLMGLYQPNGALTIAFQKLSTLQKLQAFQLSVKNSLQNMQGLLTYYDEDLSSEKENTKSLTDSPKSDTKTSDEKNVSINKTDDKDTFTKRFILNRNLALKNNISVIKSLYVNDNGSQKVTDKSAQEAINTSTLSMALLSDENEKIVIELLGSIEKEAGEKDYKLAEITSKIKTITAILSI